MLQSMRVLFLAFLATVLFSQMLQAHADYACLPNDSYQDSPYWRANLVFTGRAEKVSVENKQYVVTFAVEKNYRGDNEKSVKITSGFSFKEGERYFVYATSGKDGKSYKLDDGMCGTPPILLMDAKDDIEYAEEIASGKIGTRIYGFVYQDKQDSFKTSRQNLPLAQIEVKIKSKRNTFITQTDEKGKYVFKNIPPGEYTVTASMPKGMHEKVIKNLRYYIEGLKSHSVYIGESFLPELILLGSINKLKPFYRHWDSHSFVFTSLSSIAGKVIDFEGKIPPQQFLWLLPVDDNGKTYLTSPTQYIWMNPSNGKFVFENVPKGKYRIAVNPFNCHADRNPEYGKNFFPGVFNENHADVITLGENQTLRLKDFRLSQPMKERWFSGIVFAADKSPLANATVFMSHRGQTISNDCFSARAEVKTDEFGRFKVKGYESYAYQIRAYTETKSENQPNSRLYSKMFEISEKGNIENIELIVNSLY